MIKVARIAAASPILIASGILSSNRLFNLGAKVAGSSLRR